MRIITIVTKQIIDNKINKELLFIEKLLIVKKIN